MIAAHHAAAPARPGTVAVATGLAAFVAIGAASALYGPALPVLATDYGLPPGAAGLLLSAHGLGAFAAVAACLLPAVEGRLRRRPPIALGLMAGGALLVAALGPWPSLLAGAGAIGAGFGLVTVGFNGLFARGFGARSPSMVNLLNALFGVGAILAPMVLVWAGGSVRVGFGALAALCTVLIPPALAVDDRIGRLGEAASSETGPRAAPVAALAPPLLMVFLAVSVEACLVGWGPAILVARGASPLEAAGYASGFFAVFLAARLAAIALTAALSPRVVVVASLAGLVLIVGAAALAERPAALFVAAGATGLVFPNAFAWLSAGPLRARPGADALIVCTAFAGGAAGPFAAGVAALWIGTANLFGALLAAVVAALAMAMAIRAKG